MRSARAQLSHGRVPAFGNTLNLSFVFGLRTISTAQASLLLVLFGFIFENNYLGGLQAAETKRFASLS